MQLVYVLQSDKDGNLYIGCTANLKKRLHMHRLGAVQSTKHRLPLRLIYTEEYTDKYEAFRKERFYKTARGKKVIREKIKHCGVV